MHPFYTFAFRLGFIFIGITCQAQQHRADSLLNALQKHPQEDTFRLNLLNELTYSYCELNPTKGLAMGDQAILLAKKLPYPNKLAGAYSNKGHNYAALRQDSLALTLYKLSLRIDQQAGDQVGVGKSLHNMGLLSFGLAKYSEALEQHLAAAAIFRKLNNIRLQIPPLNSVGVNYMYLGNYPKALQNHLYVLHLGEVLGDTFEIANSLTNIGLVYRRLANYQKALTYQKQALILFERLDNQPGLANTLSSIATLYDYLNKPDEALNTHKRALKIYEFIQYKQGITSTLLNIAIVHNDQAHYQEALPYFQKAITMAESLNDPDVLGLALNELSRLYLKAPEQLLRQLHISPKNRYTTVIAYQQRALQLAQKTEALERQEEIWHDLSETYNAQGNFAGALSAYKKYISLRDSLVNEEKKSEIIRQEMQFAQQKREAVLNAKHEAAINEQRTERNAVMGGSALLLLSGAGGFWLFKRRREADQKRKEAELKAEIADTEMKALRAQMNPHFIFNSLNSIGDYMNKHDTVSADYYLTKFAKLMRLILENSEKKQVTLADDLQALELYMQLEAMRMRNHFTYEIQVDDAIDPTETLIPPLLLQPFVENSIWHGLAWKDGAGKITVRILKEGDMIKCVVEDDGVGRKQAEAAEAATEAVERKSLGMKITNARIAIINQQRKQASNRSNVSAVMLSDLAGGTRVEVKLPLELSF